MSPAWFGLSSLPTRRSVIRPVLMIFPLFLSCLLTFCHSGGVIWGRGPGRVKISVLFYSFLPLHLTDPLKSNSTMCCRGRERRGRGGPPPPPPPAAPPSRGALDLAGSQTGGRGRELLLSFSSRVYFSLLGVPQWVERRWRLDSASACELHRPAGAGSSSSNSVVSSGSTHS